MQLLLEPDACMAPPQTATLLWDLGRFISLQLILQDVTFYAKIWAILLAKMQFHLRPGSSKRGCCMLAAVGRVLTDTGWSQPGVGVDRCWAWEQGDLDSSLTSDLTCEVTFTYPLNFLSFPHGAICKEEDNGTCLWKCFAGYWIKDVM